VLTRQEVIGHLHTVTVAPITTTIRGIPSEVVIRPESGPKAASAVNLDNVATVPKAGLRGFVGPSRHRSSRTSSRRCSSPWVTTLPNNLSDTPRPRRRAPRSCRLRHPPREKGAPPIRRPFRAPSPLANYQSLTPHIGK
jgi:hypothetical protein